MSRSNPFVFLIAMLIFVAVFGGVSLTQGGLYIDTHEGDTYHLMDILFRMELGQKPHIDFVTPIGILAFLPIIIFMDAGFGVGMAFLWSQIAVALILLPIVVYAARTRLSPAVGYLFALLVLGLTLAMTYGGSGTGASISMHYNRWAWAASFLLLLIGILPAKRRPRQVVDGAIIGVLSAALLMIKVTFFVCLVPVVAIALLWSGQRTAFLAALVSGAAGVAASVAVFGVSHWVGYYNDLYSVATSIVRPSAGVGFDEIVAGPEFIGPLIVAMAAAMLLRRTDRDREGTLLLLLIPGFIYIVYQNFGNDPKWLLFLLVLLLTLKPEPGAYTLRNLDLASVSNWLAAAVIAFALPSLYTMARSPLSHLAIKSHKFIPMLPAQPDGQDVFIRNDRANTLTAQFHVDEEVEGWSKYREIVGREPVLEVAGVRQSPCEFFAATHAYFYELSADLRAANLPEDSQVFNADALSAHWLFGGHAPLKGASPWYYGRLTGIENADYVMIPKCAIVWTVTMLVVEELKLAGAELTLVRDSDFMYLFEVELPGEA